MHGNVLSQRQYNAQKEGTHEEHLHTKYYICMVMNTNNYDVVVFLSSDDMMDTVHDVQTITSTHETCL